MCFDFQRACASTKSIPCFALLLSLFPGSNSTADLLTRRHRRRDYLHPIQVPEAFQCTHHKRLTIDDGKAMLGQLDRFAIARWPRLARLDRRAFHLADRDHLPRVRFGQLAPANKPAALAHLGQIFAHLCLIFRHCAFTIHHKRLMIVLQYGAGVEGRVVRSTGKG
jgi:hypothetical protein